MKEPNLVAVEAVVSNVSRVVLYDSNAISEHEAIAHVEAGKYNPTVLCLHKEQFEAMFQYLFEEVNPYLDALVEQYGDVEELLIETDYEMLPHEGTTISRRIQWLCTSGAILPEDVAQWRAAVADIWLNGIDAGRSIPNKINAVIARNLLFNANPKNFCCLIKVAMDPNLILPDDDFDSLDNYLKELKNPIPKHCTNGWSNISAIEAGAAMYLCCFRAGCLERENATKIGKIIVRKIANSKCCLDVCERFDAVYTLLTEGADDGRFMEQALPARIAEDFLCEASIEAADILLNIAAGCYSYQSAPFAVCQTELDALNKELNAFILNDSLEC